MAILDQITLERYKEMSEGMTAEECYQLASKYDFEANMIGCTDNPRQLVRQGELRASTSWWRRQAERFKKEALL